MCSAGNTYNTYNNQTIYQWLVYPAAFHLANTISVGASDSNDVKWSGQSQHSNYGADYYVDLFAPGVSVYTTASGGGYAYVTGTSPSAAYVTGVASLLMAYDSSLEACEIKSIIRSNVDIVSGLDSISGGRLNAYKALTHVAHHTFAYSYDSSMFYHTKTCTTCAKSYQESHTWTYYQGYYYCTCGKVSSFIPVQ